MEAGSLHRPTWGQGCRKVKLSTKIPETGLEPKNCAQRCFIDLAFCLTRSKKKTIKSSDFRTFLLGKNQIGKQRN